MNRVFRVVFCLLLSAMMASPAAAGGRYEGFHGYRERPYDRGRHYGHYKHRDHRYKYHGHWRSWDDWERYARKHPEVRRHGRYYHDGAHLMFRSCVPDSDTCVFFSIGR